MIESLQSNKSKNVQQDAVVRAAETPDVRAAVKTWALSEQIAADLSNSQ